MAGGEENNCKMWVRLTDGSGEMGEQYRHMTTTVSLFQVFEQSWYLTKT